jgi:hypothetical protein
MKDLEIKLRKHFCFHGAGTLEEISGEIGSTVDKVKEALENTSSFTVHKFSDANGVVRYNSTPFSSGGEVVNSAVHGPHSSRS